MNNIIIDNNKDELVGKKKSIKIDDNNINNENKNFSQDKNERKNTNNNTIINILNKPFFCCLKS